MELEKIYRVADLPFRVRCQGPEFLPDKMHNMTPFVSGLEPGEEPLFTLDLVHAPLP